MTSKTTNKFSPEVCDRTMRLVLDHERAWVSAGGGGVDLGQDQLHRADAERMGEEGRARKWEAWPDERHLDLLQMPFRDQDVLDAVVAAISGYEEHRMTEERSASLKARFARQTSREQRVMALVIEGLRSIQAAGRLSLGKVTVRCTDGA